MTTHDRALNRFVIATLALFLIFGFVSEGPITALEGFLRLQISPTRLISDFTVVGGPGAAFLNASAVGILGILLLRINKIQFSGPTVAAIFTMMGFALFGKTLMSSIPIILGVELAALLVRKQPKEYVLIAMFGTALGPVISFVAFEMGLPPAFALPVSMLIGVATGIILPPIAIAMLHLHQGYNLYNMGLAAGFVGLFASSIPNAGGKDMALTDVWGTGSNPFLIAVVPILCFLAVMIGWLASRKSVWKEFAAIQKLTGRLPSDFCEQEGAGGALLNAGALGLAYCVFLVAINAPFNGPVIGGLMTVIGFGLFGKHFRNVAPVFAGLLFAALFFGKPLSTSWVILAMLFGSAVAPLAGEFGPYIGFVAGMLHLMIVERSGTWQGGMNLYNNGFAGGLTATLIVSIIEWYRTNRER